MNIQYHESLGFLVKNFEKKREKKIIKSIVITTINLTDRI